MKVAKGFWQQHLGHHREGAALRARTSRGLASAEGNSVTPRQHRLKWDGAKQTEHAVDRVHYTPPLSFNPTKGIARHKT